MSYEFKKQGKRNELKSITTREETFRYLHEEFNAQLIPLIYRLKKGEDKKNLGKAPTKTNWKILKQVRRYEEFRIDARRQNAGLITGDETRLIVVDSRSRFERVNLSVLPDLPRADLFFTCQWIKSGMSRGFNRNKLKSCCF